jgi:cyclopropane-fatty-acyl-phospholipid synthase
MTEVNYSEIPFNTVTGENRSEVLRGAPISLRVFASALEKLNYGSMSLVTPHLKGYRINAPEDHHINGIIHIKNYAMVRRTLLGGGIGLYESFADDQWETPDLANVLYVFARNAGAIQQVIKGHPILRVLNNFHHKQNRNTRAGSRRNIMAHYDLGNAFYEKWLDPSMTYSSALFDRPDQPLLEAQFNKNRNLARQIGLQTGESVLEIGSGWGGFAEFAAKEVGAKVTGVTISPEQFDYAQERMFREGLNEKVDIRLQDYRDIDEKFDKIASIEMFEAVGQEYWPIYFNKVHQSLKDGGRAGFQIITIANQFFDQYSKSPDFIQRHVFPGGMLPSPKVLKEEVEKAGMRITENLSFGQDYATTLNRWHEKFLSVWDELVPLGFDDKFKKLWRFYLAYCEAGFKAGTTDVCQVSVAKG